ncbi:MAG: GNAT family N-acetyltransferase [Clostridia bacterium]|nr:GNAT family N-acetyltransferase [Clostridia bacterium]
MIRPVTAAELPACVRLIRESFATVARTFGITPENAPRFTAFAATEERLAFQLAEGRPMLAYDEDGQICGYYSLHRLSETVWELNNLCVHPDCRHRKIGEALLLDCFERVRKAGGTLLQIGIVEENEKLRRWYASYGFVHTGTRKFDFFPFTCGYMEKNIG